MSKLSLKLNALGVAQTSRHVLPIVALTLAKAAADDLVKPDDALEVYIDYYKASSHLKTIDPYDNGVKANVSKLRQIIKARDPGLLAQVTRRHELLQPKARCRPLYQAMVMASRIKVATGKRPTAAQIDKIIRF